MIDFFEKSHDKVKLVESELLKTQNELKLETKNRKKLIPKYTQKIIQEIAELFNTRDF